MGTYLTSAKVEITPDCNHNCDFCYNPERSGVALSYLGESKRVTPQKLDAVLDRMIAFGIDYFNFTGGEPLLRRDLLFSGIKKIRDSRRVASINSNVALCTEEDALRLTDLGVYAVCTTFHSYDRDRFNAIAGSKTFNRVKNGITYLIKAGVPVAANIVVTQQNKGDVHDTARFLVDLGINSLSITPICPSTRDQIKYMLSREEILNIVDEALLLREETGIPLKTLRPLPHCIFPKDPKYDLFKNGCSIDGDEITVVANGDFKVCASYHSTEGNIFDKTIQELIDLSKQTSLVKRETLVECVGCIELETCRGGCPLEELILKEAGLIHPYRDPTNQDQQKKKKKVMPRLLHEHIAFDDQIKIRPEREDRVVVYANGSEIVISKSEFNVLGELVRRTKKDPDFKPWDLAMDLVLDKNILNMFLHYLKEGKIINIA